MMHPARRVLPGSATHERRGGDSNEGEEEDRGLHGIGDIGVLEERRTLNRAGGWAIRSAHSRSQLPWLTGL